MEFGTFDFLSTTFGIINDSILIRVKNEHIENNQPLLLVSISKSIPLLQNTRISINSPADLLRIFPNQKYRRISMTPPEHTFNHIHFH